MSEMMLSLLALSPLSLLSFSFAPCGFFKCENDSGVNQNRYLLQLIGEFRLNAAIGRVAAGTAFYMQISFRSTKAVGGLNIPDAE